MSLTNYVNSLKKIVINIFDYLSLQLIILILASFFSIGLYFFEYSWSKFVLHIFYERLKYNLILLSLLNLYLVYPLIWFVGSFVIKKYFGKHIKILLTIFSMMIGLTIVKLIISFSLFFDYKFGGFPLLLAFTLGVPLLEYIKLKTFKALKI